MGGNTEREKAVNSEANSPGNGDGARIISYNVNEGERPAGLKIRWKVRIETGKKAEALNARQAEAIKELLTWAHEHRAQQQPAGPQD
jgi:hypothetical protein